MTIESSSPLPVLIRFYIYAIHGHVVEIVFTAAWEFFTRGCWKWRGESSVWALPIYGLSTLVIENLSSILKKRKIPILLRGLIYLMWIYSWEFSTGFALRYFGACPWDYEPWFNFHVMGLITFEYAPLWYLCSLFTELVLIRYTLRLRLTGSDGKTHSKSHAN